MGIATEGNERKVSPLMLTRHINVGASTDAGNGKGNVLFDDANGNGEASGQEISPWMMTMAMDAPGATIGAVDMPPLGCRNR